MAITSLQIDCFRNINALTVNPIATGLNIISGENGSGKTSLLEVIYYLSLGRSFRTSQLKSLIQHRHPKLSVVAYLNTGVQEATLGVERDITGMTRLRFAEKDAAVTDFAYALPVRLINSQSQQLFESGPSARRKFMDWGLFYQSEQFLTVWRQFERALKQRNAALKERRPPKEITGWTREVAKYGLAFHELRRAYMATLMPFIDETTAALLNLPHLEMSYLPGWDEAIDYETILNEQVAADIVAGYTQAGPHRADFMLQIHGVPVKQFLSRGQQKLLICAMILAQGMLLATSKGKDLIYLIDDLPAELDQWSRQKLISLLAKQHTQVFITSIDSESVTNLLEDDLAVKRKVFHVEHGRIGASTQVDKSSLGVMQK